MNYVLVAKEYIDFETKKYNVACASEQEIEQLHELAKALLKTAKEEGIDVTLYLEAYDEDGAFLEYSRYEEREDEFKMITKCY